MNSSGQRGYEAPACVQNAMMTKDKKPFTYTPGGIDLSQIKSERMAKRLARNAQAEGATGASQLNRPTQPTSPGTNNGANVTASMGAAAMGMPFQVLPPPPPPMAPGGKKTNGTPAPPPPPPSSLAPPANGKAPGSPSAARKSPTPQRFEPPPLGFRPEIKMPPNPMAALRKVPPPVEKNLFWKDEYVKERSKSPMAGGGTNSPPNGPAANTYSADANENSGNSYANDSADGYKKPPEVSNNSGYAQQHSPPAQSSPQQHVQQPQQYSTPPPPPPPTPPQQQQYHSPQAQQPQGQASPQFRSVIAPQSPSVNVYTRQTDSPRSDAGTPPQQRATESPFKFAQQQQQQQQQQPRAPPAISPLAQQHPQPATPQSAQSQSQTVPWRTQRAQQPATSQQQQAANPQQIFNNVQQQQPRSRDVLSPAVDLPSQQQQYGTQSQYQGPKPTNVGSLYIAPLAPPTEPQAQNIVRQQMQKQQQQQQRDSPMRQIPMQQQQQQSPQQPQQQQTMRPTANWMRTQPTNKEQPEWARPEENGNVVPSSLNRLKSPPPPAMMQQQQTAYQQPMPAPQQQYHSMPSQGNGYAPTQNFGAQTSAPAGLRLQINLVPTSGSSSGPRERIIPIQLEQTPTSSPAGPNFNVVQYPPNSANAAAAGYVIRSPNQFVDQGYNNYPAPAHQQQQQLAQQLNAPRIIQQQQQQMNNNIGGTGGARTRIVPISIDGEGTRGPISHSPIILQNDQRTPPVQSKSFRILQKITDTVDDGSSDGASTPTASKNDSYVDAEPQLQRPQFARQMSAQQARHSPTVEQMKRMQIAQEQQKQHRNQGKPTTQTNNFVQQRFNSNDMPQQYVHPSEQHVPEPKKYTGSAIPSRSFKILQAMTTPENAGPGQSDL